MALSRAKTVTTLRRFRVSGDTPGNAPPYISLFLPATDHDFRRGCVMKRVCPAILSCVRYVAKIRRSVEIGARHLIGDRHLRGQHPFNERPKGAGQCQRDVVGIEPAVGKDDGRIRHVATRRVGQRGPPRAPMDESPSRHGRQFTPNTLLSPHRAPFSTSRISAAEALSRR